MHTLAWTGKLVLSVVAGTLLCLIFVIATSSQPAWAATCSDSLQDKIDMAPVGSTVKANACVYREQVEISKPLTLMGQPGSEIRGSDVWGGWTRQSNGTYLSSKAVPVFYQEDVSCEIDTKRCAWPEQVFINGAPQLQVAGNATLRSRQFKVRSDRKVVLGSDPRGKTVEVTVRRHWITGTSRADGVTIQGFTMRHAANDWRAGAIQSREPTTGCPSSCQFSRFKADGYDWNLIDSEVGYSHGAAVSLRSQNADIENNTIHHSGQLGIHNPGNGSVVSGNAIYSNNTEHFCIRPSTEYCHVISTDGNTTLDQQPLTESGGMKIAGGQGFVTVVNNDVYKNYGNGIWFDVGTHDVSVSDNRTYENARRGIFFEISDGADIHHNIVYENGWATPDFLDGAGIEVGNSDDTSVHDNVLAWNADSIVIRCSNRNPGDESTCERVRVENNTILAVETKPATDPFAGLALAWSGNPTLFDSANDNGGVGNDYYYGYSENGRSRFAWGTRYTTLDAFDSTPGEESGDYLSDAEKNTVTENKDIPDTPSHN